MSMCMTSKAAVFSASGSGDWLWPWHGIWKRSKGVQTWCKYIIPLTHTHTRTHTHTHTYIHAKHASPLTHTHKHTYRVGQNHTFIDIYGVYIRFWPTLHIHTHIYTQNTQAVINTFGRDIRCPVPKRFHDLLTLASGSHNLWASTKHAPKLPEIYSTRIWGCLSASIFKASSV